VRGDRPRIPATLADEPP